MEDDDKNRLKTVLQRLEEKLKEPKNFWIFDELRRIVDNCDIADIRRTLNIRGVQSIDYSFVDDPTVHNQLVIDNLRMENNALDVQTKTEETRFYDFCQNAFFQVEGIINYYLVKRFGNTPELLSYVEEMSNNERNQGYKRKKDDKKVEDIPISFKLYAVCHDLLTTDDSTWFKDLRKVRNYRAHRSSNADGDEIKKINDFLETQNFSSIRARLQKLTTTIKSHIESGFKPIERIGSIVTIFPAAAFIEIDGETFSTDGKLDGFVKGDKIKIWQFINLGKGKCKLIKYEKL